jgi:alkylhydroperoxidase/carboxymuconolactone decarboxylase family protein
MIILNVKEKPMSNYYDSKDLVDFPNITEFAKEQGETFFQYYSSATSAGTLTEREKTLIALAVATTQKCPYCIDAYTNKCLSLGISNDEMMEAVHTGAAMVAGVVLAHSTQMRKIIKKKEM